MKKCLSVILMVFLLFSIIAVGCSGSQSSSSQPQSSSSQSQTSSSGQKTDTPKTKMTISCLTGGSNQDYADRLKQFVVEKFNKENKFNVEFVMEDYANEQYKTKITTLMASNAQPDVFYSWEAGFIKPFVEGGKVYPIGDKIMADAEWWDRFPDKSVFGPLTFDGKIYGVPNTRQICIITYNTEMFQKVGAKVPTTYDEFVETCELLKKGGYTPLIIPCGEAWYAGQFLQQLANGIGGVDLYEGICNGTTTWDDPRFIEAGQMLASLVTKGYLPDNYLGMTPTEAFDMIANGKVAMFYHITSGINKLGGETSAAYGKLAFFRLPAKYQENSGLNVGSIGNSYAVSSKALNIDAACELVKYMSDVDYQSALATDLGQIIVTNTKFDQSKVDPLAAQAQPLFDEVTTYTPWFDRIFGAGEGVELNNAAVAIMSGQDPAEAMKALQQFAIDNATR